MDIAGAIREIFKFLSVVSDPAKRKEGYRLHLEKKRNIALEAAEKFILTHAEWMAEKDKKDRKRFLKKMERYKRKFFAYN